MDQAKVSLDRVFEEQLASKTNGEHREHGQHRDHRSRVQPEYTTVVNPRRQFVEVSPSFCKLLGYTQGELIGRSYDEFTVPGTSNIPSVLELFLQNGHMEGIWVLAHRSGTKLFVRYEASLRKDGFYESRMQLLAAGA
jgi:PAS domain S-box-containing protein